MLKFAMTESTGMIWRRIETYFEHLMQLGKSVPYYDVDKKDVDPEVIEIVLTPGLTQ